MKKQGSKAHQLGEDTRREKLHLVRTIGSSPPRFKFQDLKKPFYLSPKTDSELYGTSPVEIESL